MADTYIPFDDTTPHGRQLRRHLQQIEEGITGLVNDVNVMEQMRDGDGANVTHYALVTTKFGTGTDAEAKALHDEIASYIGKETTDASVSSVDAARKQLLNRTR